MCTEVGVPGAKGPAGAAGDLAHVVSALQNEAAAAARLHLHLAERINTQMVEPLEAFAQGDVWRAARDASQRVHQLASDMRSCHEQIPKLSARAAAKAPRASQQERLDAEKRRLLELQQAWQTEIAALVGEFESVDAARFEHVRESVLKYEHYRCEFIKAMHARSSEVKAAAQGLRPQERVAAAVAQPAGARPEAAGAIPHASTEPVYPDDASDRSASKGFLKLGIFRSKTKRVKKKASAASHSVASSEMSANYGGSSGVTSPDMGGPATVLSAHSAHELGRADPEDPGAAPGFAAHPRALERTGSSLVSSHSTEQSDGVSVAVMPRDAGADDYDVAVRESSGDTAEWVITGHTQDSPEHQADDRLSADSLVHISRLSVIEETSDNTHSSPVPVQSDASPNPAQPQPATSDPSAHYGQDEAASPLRSHFDDAFTPLVLSGSASTGSNNTGGIPVAAEGARRPSEPFSGAQVDLDSVFAVPPQPQPQPQVRAEARPSTAAGSESPGHGRSASLAPAGEAAHGSDDEAAEVEQAFRVNFSIRERAIQDNPDETKAALSRVATMLRAAPATKRRNRREVRTMYVTSDDAPGAAQAVAPAGSDLSEATPEPPAAAVPSDAPEKLLEAAFEPTPGRVSEECAGSALEREIPVATATVAAIDAPTVLEPPEPTGNEGITSMPVDGQTERDAEQTAAADQAILSPPPPPPQLRADSSTRRRAPPPPPRPAPLQPQPTSQAGESSDASSSESDVLSDSSEVSPPPPPPPSQTAYRSRRSGANSGPPPIAMEVQEVLDFGATKHEGASTEVEYRVVGEVTMHIQASVNPLELAPLRICVNRAEATQWVANPAVVVLDASLTATTADGREWYRFVRPDLFAQTERAQRVPVFKFEHAGRNDVRVLPMTIFCATTSADDTCGLLIFCEPNAKGHFGGFTVEEPAVLLGLTGEVTSQASRPTATWFRERNSLLWNLDPVHVPRADQASGDEVQAATQSLAVKAQGNNVQAGTLALRFVARGVRIVDIPLSIVRVTSGSQATTQTVVNGPASQVVRSGKCTYQSLISLVDSEHQAQSGDEPQSPSEAPSGDI
ncbi:hypothetical protein H4R19_000852 [Coemansia spiralis]|nr:hypothetical protein H4R19_000852 [Coemansia spiralis]